MDDLISKGAAKEMIVVVPNGSNRYLGSFYTNSSVSGNWEDYIYRDVVSFIDDTYRTITKPASRGIAGHSMGGYGALMLAMRQRGIFIDVGQFDEFSHIRIASRAFSAELAAKGVPHTFEMYEGDHANKIRERFEQHVVPFFARVLEF